MLPPKLAVGTLPKPKAEELTFVKLVVGMLPSSITGIPKKRTGKPQLIERIRIKPPKRIFVFPAFGGIVRW